MMPLRSPLSKYERLFVLIWMAISCAYVMFSSDVGDSHRTLASDIAELKYNDKIYHGKEKWWNPIVVEKYNLLFFHIPKVACTDFKLMFMKMMDQPDFDANAILKNPRRVRNSIIHAPEGNGLKYLSDYSREEVEEMMTSSKWTRAVFLREPRERVLSAFLDKAVKSTYFAERCCVQNQDLSDKEECERKSGKEKDFSYFLRRTLDCHDPHWSPQVESIDQKWWSSMTFIGYMSNLAEDAERLLRSIKDSNGKTAWDHYGRTGWGPANDGAFLVRDEAVHATNAHDRLREYYSSCDEEFVEQHWEEDWEIPGVDFQKVDLYDHSVVACKE